jgi:hypothetical protein
MSRRRPAVRSDFSRNAWTGVLLYLEKWQLEEKSPLVTLVRIEKVRGSIPLSSTKKNPPACPGDFHFCGSPGDSGSSVGFAARPGLPIRRLSAYTGAAARATNGGIACRALRVLKRPAFMPIPIKVIATIAAIPTNVVVIRPTVSSSADLCVEAVAWAVRTARGAGRQASRSRRPPPAPRTPPATRVVLRRRRTRPRTHPPPC